MTAKPSQNGQSAVKKTAPAKAKGHQPASVAARVAELEKTVAEMGAVLSGFVEQQAVAAVMPQIEAQIRAGIQQRIATEGWRAALNPGGTPAG